LKYFTGSEEYLIFNESLTDVSQGIQTNHSLKRALQQSTQPSHREFLVDQFAPKSLVGFISLPSFQIINNLKV